MAREDLMVINNYGLTQRTRVSASGNVKQRYSVSIDAEPVVVNLDPKQLGKKIAEAIAKLLRDRISGIAATAAPATLKARKVAARALAKGKTWATKRYAGGKLGAMPPSGDGLFNDSGRLAKSIAVGSTGDSWVVNVAANRLNPDTLDHGGSSALRAIVDRLRQYVPEFGDADALASSLPVRRAMQAATQAMFTKLQMGANDAALEIAVKVLEFARQADEQLGEAA